MGHGTQVLDRFQLYVADAKADAVVALGRFADLYQADMVPVLGCRHALALGAGDLQLPSAGLCNRQIEGTNNKPGVLKRMAYGFVNAETFEARAFSSPRRGSSRDLGLAPRFRAEPNSSAPGIRSPSTVRAGSEQAPGRYSPCRRGFSRLLKVVNGTFIWRW